jgi:hypothetical protein
MTNKIVDTRVGLSDADLESYKKVNSSLVVTIMAWNETRITIIFADVIRVLDNDANAISALCEVTKNTDFLELALRRLYEEEIPNEHPYLHYQFLDNDDIATLEIVSSSIEIKYC